jgi:hypothetical protein
VVRGVLSLLSILAVLAPGAALAGPVILGPDYDPTVGDLGVPICGSQHSQAATIPLPYDGGFDRVDLPIRLAAGSAPPLGETIGIRLYDVRSSPHLPIPPAPPAVLPANMTLLADVKLPITDAGLWSQNAVEWLPFDLSLSGQGCPPGMVCILETYWESSAQSCPLEWVGDTAGTYGGGWAYDAGVALPASDLGFRFRIILPQQPIPLPAPVWLGLGMLGLLAAARRARRR